MRARRAKQAMPETSAMQNNADIIFCSRSKPGWGFGIDSKDFMHKERRFVHGTPKNIFYIEEWIPAFAGMTAGKDSLQRVMFHADYPSSFRHVVSRNPDKTFHFSGQRSLWITRKSRANLPRGDRRASGSRSKSFEGILKGNFF